MTNQYNEGAIEAVKIAKMVGYKEAILKAKSPSCRVGKIYDGSFSDTLINGDGIFAEAFKKERIKVIVVDKN